MSKIRFFLRSKAADPGLSVDAELSTNVMQGAHGAVNKINVMRGVCACHGTMYANMKNGAKVA